MKKIVSIILVIALVFCTGCTLPGAYWTQGEIPESTEGVDLTMGEAADSVFSLNCYRKYSFNPIIATNHSNQLVCALVYENMVELDNDFEVIPNVVTEWEYNDAATSWTLTIDTTHTFHDGTPVTSKDLRYSLERAINSDRYSGRFRYYGGSTTSGDDKLVVSLAIGDTQFIKLLNIPIIKNGSYDEKYPLGSGPYKYIFEDLPEPTPTPTPDANGKTAKEEPPVAKAIELRAYEGYKGYKDLPVETIYLKEYNQAEDIINAFEDSYIDVVINDPSSYTNLGYASTNEFHQYATTNMHYIAFNEEGLVGSLAGFRYAMQFAFDRDYLVDMLDNNAVASAIPMYPTCKDYPNDLNDALRKDLQKCKTILENNGFMDADGDGELEYMGGELTVNFIMCADSSAKAGVANKFKEDMASIGLVINVQSVTWNEFNNCLTDYENLTKEQKEDEDFEELEWDMYYGETKVRNNFDITELLQKRTENNHYSCINYSHSTDESYETYMYNYLMSSDSSRASNYNAFANYLLTSRAALVIIGFEKQQLITHRQAIRGIDPNMGNPLYDFQNWTIRFKETDENTQTDSTEESST